MGFGLYAEAQRLLAILQAVGGPPDVEDGGVMQKAIEDGAGNRGIATEHFGPLGEALVGRYDGRSRS